MKLQKEWKTWVYKQEKWQNQIFSFQFEFPNMVRKTQRQQRLQLFTNMKIYISYLEKSLYKIQKM